MKKKVMRIPMSLCCCFLTAFVYSTMAVTAYGSEDDGSMKTKIDSRDVYLDMEALCGVEGLPYEFMIPQEKFIKTKIDPRDIYLDMEAMCGAEGQPYKYLIIPEKYVRVKHEPQDLKLNVHKMLTDDPSFVKGQEDID